MRTSIVVMVLSWPVAAFAEEPPAAPEATATVAAAETETMPAKRALVHVNLEINFSAAAAFKPFSIAPDIWYGVSDKFTVGLVHSFVGETGIMGGFGSGICLSGNANGCDGVYGNAGLDARYQIKTGTFGVAFDGGLFANDLSPLVLAGKAGVVGRWRPSAKSKLAVDIAPNLFFGLTEREGAQANKEVLTMPATLMYGVTPKVVAAFQVGLVLPFEQAGDNYFVPVSVGGNYMLNKRASVDAAFTFLHLAGGGNVGATGADSRTFTIGGGYAL